MEVVPPSARSVPPASDWEEADEGVGRTPPPPARAGRRSTTAQPWWPCCGAADAHRQRRHPSTAPCAPAAPACAEAEGPATDAEADARPIPDSAADSRRAMPGRGVRNADWSTDAKRGAEREASTAASSASVSSAGARQRHEGPKLGLGHPMHTLQCACAVPAVCSWRAPRCPSPSASPSGPMRRTVGREVVHQHGQHVEARGRARRVRVRLQHPLRRQQTHSRCSSSPSSDKGRPRPQVR